MKDINILYEDNHILVVEKPVNIPVQEDDTKDKDLLNILKEYIKVKYNKEGNVYLGLVHRLDRPVGGVMVFARTSKAASRLSEQIRNNEIRKYYLAVVNGKLDNEKGTLENYMYKDEKTGESKIVDKGYEKAKYAKLDYEVLEYNKEEDLTLVKILLHTGRHHQIRLQMDNIGHTLYGDQRYGKQDKKQIALWAYRLEFIHPVKKEKMQFECKPQKLQDNVWSKFNI